MVTLARWDSLSPIGERVGVRGLPLLDRTTSRDLNPSPHPSPYGRGSRPSVCYQCASILPERASDRRCGALAHAVDQRGAQEVSAVGDGIGGGLAQRRVRLLALRRILLF